MVTIRGAYGNKPKPPKPDLEPLWVYLEPSAKAKLVKYAADHNLSESKVVETAVLAWINQERAEKVIRGK